MNITIVDAEYDSETWDDIKDATLTDLGDLMLLDHDDKVCAMYARGHWRKAEILR